LAAWQNRHWTYPFLKSVSGRAIGILSGCEIAHAWVRLPTTLFPGARRLQIIMYQNIVKFIWQTIVFYSMTESLVKPFALFQTLTKVRHNLIDAMKNSFFQIETRIIWILKNIVVQSENCLTYLPLIANTNWNTCICSPINWIIIDRILWVPNNLPVFDLFLSESPGIM
jgi:hypothetical protein